MIRALEWLKGRMLLLLLGTYVLGAVLPRWGVAIRNVSTGEVGLPGGGSIGCSLPMLMLAILLVVAGLGTDLRELRQTLGRAKLLLAALLTNALYPIAFTGLVAVLLMPWHDPVEVQNILVGLAMIGAMPVAGASTAWTQNAEGSLGLSLGLVLASTLLSPVLTPMGLHAVGFLTNGDYSEDLHELARTGSSSFIAVAVVIPSVLGIAGRAVLGPRRATRLLPALKLVSLLDLLLLNYSNASIALPAALRSPDWDLLALTVVIASGMCAGAFASGYHLARVFRAGRPDQTSLMYGLGMSNNGTGLVLASSALADHPLVMLPIIVYNLVQQSAAATVAMLRRRRPPA